MPNKQLIQRLRKAFNLPESMVSDEKILVSTKDTLTRAGIELNMEGEVLIDALKKEFTRITSKMPVNFINERVN